MKKKPDERDAKIILALIPEQIRMLSVYHRVPAGPGGVDLRALARMASLPFDTVRDLYRGLEEMGAVCDGGLNPFVEEYLQKLAKDRLER